MPHIRFCLLGGGGGGGGPHHYSTEVYCVIHVMVYNDVNTKWSLGHSGLDETLARQEKEEKREKNKQATKMDSYI